MAPLPSLAVYFDESGTEAASDVVVVAGWIATTVQWQRFSGEWSKILKAARLDPPVFHATDYEAMRDWKPEKKVRVRQRLITSIHKRVRGHSIAVVVKSPYDAIAPEGLHPDISVGVFAVLEAVKKVGDWLARREVTHDVAYFFENRSENRGEVESVMKHVENSPRLRETFRYATWGWVPKDSPPAQAADMLAYEVWKECINGLRGPTPRRFPMRRSLQALTHLVPNFTHYSENSWVVERRKKAEALAAGKPWPS